MLAQRRAPERLAVRPPGNIVQMKTVFVLYCVVIGGGLLAALLVAAGQ
jgi:hypothetical protein